ncbi:hypothetical protein BGZ49_002017 [Haplosporangium sp. Z 27]|nr:hypothetical protein BGZ49_002017 [Haplosporangium sp. Z 27]
MTSLQQCHENNPFFSTSLYGYYAAGMVAHINSMKTASSVSVSSATIARFKDDEQRAPRNPLCLNLPITDNTIFVNTKSRMEKYYLANGVDDRIHPKPKQCPIQPNKRTDTAPGWKFRSLKKNQTKSKNIRNNFLISPLGTTVWPCIVAAMSTESTAPARQYFHDSTTISMEPTDSGYSSEDDSYHYHTSKPCKNEGVSIGADVHGMVPAESETEWALPSYMDEGGEQDNAECKQVIPKDEKAISETLVSTEMIPQYEDQCSLLSCPRSDMVAYGRDGIYSLW